MLVLMVLAWFVCQRLGKSLGVSDMYVGAEFKVLCVGFLFYGLLHVLQ